MKERLVNYQSISVGDLVRDVDILSEKYTVVKHIGRLTVRGESRGRKESIWGRWYKTPKEAKEDADKAAGWIYVNGDVARFVIIERAITNAEPKKPRIDLALEEL